MNVNVCGHLHIFVSPVMTGNLPKVGVLLQLRHSQLEQAAGPFDAVEDERLIDQGWPPLFMHCVLNTTNKSQGKVKPLQFQRCGGCGTVN